MFGFIFGFKRTAIAFISVTVVFLAAYVLNFTLPGSIAGRAIRTTGFALLQVITYLVLGVMAINLYNDFIEKHYYENFDLISTRETVERLIKRVLMKPLKARLKCFYAELLLVSGETDMSGQALNEAAACSNERTQPFVDYGECALCFVKGDKDGFLSRYGSALRLFSPSESNGLKEKEIYRLSLNRVALEAMYKSLNGEAEAAQNIIAAVISDPRLLKFYSVALARLSEKIAERAGKPLKETEVQDLTSAI